MDQWTRKHQALFPFRQLHAIGIINMAFALAERNMHHLAWSYSGLDEKIGSTHTFDAAPGTLANKLRYILHLREQNDCLKDAVQHGICCFLACQTNRNKVSHFTVHQADFEEIVTRPNRGPEPKVSVHKADVCTLRAAADGALATAMYLANLSMLVRRCMKGETGTSMVQPDALPDKPPIPTLLPQVLPPSGQ
jgi:hypothetical protein